VAFRDDKAGQQRGETKKTMLRTVTHEARSKGCSRLTSSYQEDSISGIRGRRVRLGTDEKDSRVPRLPLKDAAMRRRPQTVLANGETDAVRMVRVRLPSESDRCQSIPGMKRHENPVPRGAAGPSGQAAGLAQLRPEIPRLVPSRNVGGCYLNSEPFLGRE
jgi:hypothetical protein